MREIVWGVFEKSGQIESYLLYKTFTYCQGEEDEEADNENDTYKGCDPALL